MMKIKMILKRRQNR